MGVHDLGGFLKKNCHDYQFELPLSSFAKTAWGIDGLNTIFRNFSIAIKNVLDHQKNIFEPIDQEKIRMELRKRLFDFNKKLTDHNITPVWVWDGTSQISKLQTQNDRREKKQKQKEKATAYREELLEKDILDIKPEEEKKYTNLLSTSLDFPEGELDNLKRIMKEMGIPTVTAVDEAENLCSSWCVEGKISLVWSNDTDTYPLGACKVASTFLRKKGVFYVSGVEPRKAISQTGLSYREFRDFCILLGNDFNDRIYRMGPITSFKIIKQYKSLEEIEKKTNHNLTFMNYKKVRKQFIPYDTHHQVEIHFKVEKCDDLEKIENLEKEVKFELQSHISSIRELRLDEVEYSEDED